MKTTISIHEYACINQPVKVERPATAGEVPMAVQQRFHDLSCNFHIAHHVQSAVKRAVEKEKEEPMTDEQTKAFELLEQTFNEMNEETFGTLDELLAWGFEEIAQYLTSNSLKELPELPTEKGTEYLWAAKEAMELPEHLKLLWRISSGESLNLLEFMPKERGATDAAGHLKKMIELLNKKGNDAAKAYVSSLSEEMQAAVKAEHRKAMALMEF